MEIWKNKFEKAAIKTRLYLEFVIKTTTQLSHSNTVKAAN